MDTKNKEHITSDEHETGPELSVPERILQEQKRRHTDLVENYAKMRRTVAEARQDIRDRKNGISVEHNMPQSEDDLDAKQWLLEECATQIRQSEEYVKELESRLEATKGQPGEEVR